MPDKRKYHALRRVREGMAECRERSILAEVRPFAERLGVSESLIRNVENRVADLSRKLAFAVQEKMGVSAEWLLSDPGSDEPIKDVRGREWGPLRHSPFGYLPNFERLLAACPTLLPRIVARLVEIQMLKELNEEGSIQTMLLLLRAMDSRDFFEEGQRLDLPPGWLRPEDSDAGALVNIGIRLLMERKSEFAGDRPRDLEHLRLNEPEIPKHSELPRLYKWMEQQRKRADKRRANNRDQKSSR